jgi:glycosyltransferase involved in cell wall biosynthesis
MSQLRRIGYVLGTTTGGTGRHVAMLAAGCAGTGFLVTVVGPPEVADLFPGVAFHPVRIAARPRPARDLVAVLRIHQTLARAATDVVHAHGLRAGALAALAVRRMPLVVTVHNAPPRGALAAGMYAVLERIVARRAAAVVCVSSDLEDRMRRRRAAHVGRAVVPAARGASTVAAPCETSTGPAVLAPDGRPVVLAVGRLTAQKGFDVLLEAAARWRERRPEPFVAIAGSGPLAASLHSQARDLGLDAAFLGERQDVAALLAAADVFVLPSRWEGQPLVVQEALRAGRPIVASDVPGVRDLTGDDAALLVPPGDPAALGDAVARVLDDAALAAGLGAAARSRCAALPAEADAVSSALDLYRRLVS